MILWLHRFNAAVFVAIGIYFLACARTGAANLGIDFPQGRGLTDFRATYGGICLALGIFFGWATLRPDWLLAATWLGVLVYSGLAITRGFGLFIDGDPSSLMKVLFVVESLLIVAHFIAARR